MRADLNILNPDTIYDVGPRGSGRTTRLINWSMSPPGHKLILVDNTAEASAIQDRERMCDVLPISLLVHDHLHGSTVSDIAVDNYDKLTESSFSILASIASKIPISYVTLEGQRSGFTNPAGNETALKLRLMAKRVREGIEVTAEDLAEGLEKAARIVTPHDGVFELIEKLDDGWEIGDL